MIVIGGTVLYGLSAAASRQDQHQRHARRKNTRPHRSPPLTWLMIYRVEFRNCLPVAMTAWSDRAALERGRGRRKRALLSRWHPPAILQYPVAGLQHVANRAFACDLGGSGC